MAPDTEQIPKRLLHALGRAAARESQRRDVERQTRPDQLERSVREYLGRTKPVIASHREPYQHVRRNGSVQALRSAGGLASALDSVARATGAVWVARASGDADRETADERGRVSMPPGQDRYTLQRVWIDDEARRGLQPVRERLSLAPLPRRLRASTVRGRTMARVPGSESHVRRRAIVEAAETSRRSCSYRIITWHLRRRDPCATPGPHDCALLAHPWPPAEMFRILPGSAKSSRGSSRAMSSASTSAITE
jgi:hypothetical protein